MFKSKLDESTDVDSSSHDIWEYFATEIVPIISDSQVESPTKGLARVETAEVAVDINIWLANFLNQLQSCNLSLTQVKHIMFYFHHHFCTLKFCPLIIVGSDPDVTNKDKSRSFVAIAVGDLLRLGVKCQKNELECVVSQQGCGIVNDLWYFLKPDATDDHMSEVACRKMRCYSIDKHYIDKDVQHNINTSEYDYIICDCYNDYIFTVPYINFVVTQKRQQCTGDEVAGVEKQPSKEDDKDVEVHSKDDDKDNHEKEHSKERKMLKMKKMAAKKM